ncbi:MAG: phenylalanine--tRNA ligase subunit beta, partial [Porphyromonadaceae bacterium]|nr:phenylalanine--tRNA ligase subunit beta [Porphyromonadaceae bacterium]
MNISYNWLKEYLDFTLTPDETAAALTSIGLETGSVEEVQAIKGGLEGVVIGKVLTCEAHPNSDHLHITTVDLGDGTPVQIVCGAPNVAAGQHVVVATIGTVLYAGEEHFTIKKSKIRGAESNGMICAEDEIGVGPSHDGIIVLPEDTLPGTPAKEYYHLESDYIFEVDITPNRVDATSHYGVARDLAAWLKQNGYPYTLKRPSVESFKIDNPTGKAVTVEVENAEACPRYSGLTIRHVKVAESPEWLRRRLSAIGLRPINNIVDITNYLLHEMGQPMHCLDVAHIAGEKIRVKTLPDKTPFTTLDGEEHTLSDQDLMICDEREGLCIAGVFGGLQSGVTLQTTDVFLESAYFNPMWVRKTARRQGLSTDSSFRFERGTDPNNTLYVLKRAALLVKELAGGEIVGDIIDLYPHPIDNYPVTLRYDHIAALVGKAIPEETVKSILQSLEVEIVEEKEGTLSLKVPTYRVDVRRPCDVIEDILRIYGYNNVEFTDNVHSNLSYKTATDNNFRLQNLIAEQLVGCGFNEIMNNSLTKLPYYADSELYPESRGVKLLNPLSGDLGVLRQTLLFGGIESIAHNINRRRPDLRLFEFGNCYAFDPAADGSQDPLKPYSESLHLGLWLTGNRVSGNWAHPDEKSSVYELKAYVENILARLGVERDTLVMTQTSDEIFAEALVLSTRSGKKVGALGIVSEKILKRFDLSAEIAFADLHWSALM